MANVGELFQKLFKEFRHPVVVHGWSENINDTSQWAFLKSDPSFSIYYGTRRDAAATEWSEIGLGIVEGRLEQGKSLLLWLAPNETKTGFDITSPAKGEARHPVVEPILARAEQLAAEIFPQVS